MMNTQPIRLILADDHVLVRRGLRSLLEGMAGIQIAGEADDGREALRLIQELRPDVVLMDIAMPNLNGLDATMRALKQNPGVRILALSMHSSQRHVAEALRAGASGYLLKSCDTEELEKAIRAVARGGKYLSPAISDVVIDAFVINAEQSRDMGCPLSPRQREILQLVAEGHSSPEIAELLHLSRKTVDGHRAEIMARLSIHDVTGLVRYAIGMGLVSPEIQPRGSRAPCRRT